MDKDATWARCGAQGFPDVARGQVVIAVGGAERLRDDLVDHAEAQRVLGGDAQRFRRVPASVRSTTPENGGAAFRSDHGIDGMLQQTQDPIPDPNTKRAAAAALAGDDHHRMGREQEHLFDVACNGFADAVLFAGDGRVRAGSIDQADDGPAELFRKPHQPQRFAVAFRFGHAEVAAVPFLRIAALCSPTTVTH